MTYVSLLLQIQLGSKPRECLVSFPKDIINNLRNKQSILLQRVCN